MKTLFGALVVLMKPHSVMRLLDLSEDLIFEVVEWLDILFSASISLTCRRVHIVMQKVQTSRRSLIFDNSTLRFPLVFSTVCSPLFAHFNILTLSFGCCGITNTELCKLIKCFVKGYMLNVESLFMEGNKLTGCALANFSLLCTKHNLLSRAKILNFNFNPAYSSLCFKAFTNALLFGTWPSLKSLLIVDLEPERGYKLPEIRIETFEALDHAMETRNLCYNGDFHVDEKFDWEQERFWY